MEGGKNPLEINFHQRNRLGPPSGRTKDIVIICGPVPWKVSICQQCQPTNASFLEIEQENLFIQDRGATPSGGGGRCRNRSQQYAGEKVLGGEEGKCKIVAFSCTRECHIGVPKCSEMNGWFWRLGTGVLPQYVIKTF